MLDCGEHTVVGLYRHGDFPAPFRLGRNFRWRLSDVEGWIDRIPDVNGKFVGEAERLPWSIDPRQLQQTLDFTGRALPFPACEVAVYFLVRDGKVMYVGQTTDLPGRVSKHRLAGKQKPDRRFDLVFYLPVPEGVLLTLERRYITLFAPPWNVQGNVGQFD